MGTGAGDGQREGIFELRFPRPDRPLSINERVHWAERARRLRPWREAVWAAWAQARDRRAAIVGRPCLVEVELPFARGSGRRDPHNFTGTVVKAIVDELVRQGCWPDDTPDWVTVLDPVCTVGDEAVVRLIPRAA